MATFAAVILLLATSLNAVWSVKQCYQSSCLPHNLVSCFSDQRASLATCSYEDFLLTAEQLSASLPHDSHNSTSMICVSFEAAGEVDHRTHGVVIRMCYPDVAEPCRSLEQHTRQHMAVFGIHNTSFTFACRSCHADGCNSAPAQCGGGATAAALLAAAALTCVALG